MILNLKLMINLHRIQKVVIYRESTDIGKQITITNISLRITICTYICMRYIIIISAELNQIF